MKDGMNSFDYLKNEEDLDRIRRVVAGRPAERLLFELSVSSGLRLTEILYLKVKDVVCTTPLSFVLTPAAKAALDEYLAGEAPENEHYLFHRKNDGNRCVSVPYASGLISKWFDDAGLEGHYAARSLYKTYEHFKGNGGGETAADGSDYHFLAKNRVSSREKQIFELLYGSIISGGLPVNTCINVNSTAAELNTGSTVVRIALAKLEEVNLVERVSSNVYRIKAYSEQYITELFQLRELLECHAFDRAVMNWDDRIVTELDHLVDRWRAEYDAMYATGFHTQGIIDCVHYHSEFHTKLYSTAGIPVTVKLIAELADKTNASHLRHYSREWVLREEEYQGIADHQVLVDALRAHNFEECRRVLIDNIRKGYRICMANIGEKTAQA